MRNKLNKDNLYCFSPLVMLTTLIIELCLAVYVFWRIKPSRLKALIVFTIVLLAVFQAAEFFVCSRYSLEAVNIASRIGFVAITFLPPLSIHIANETVGRRNNWAIIACYIPAFVLAVIFSILPNTISSTMCTGRYVIFQLEGLLSYIYPIYYFGLLFGILGTSFYLARKEKNQKKRYALLWLMVGTLSFMIPTAIVYWVVPDSAYTIPSVMCGFAIIYAFILTTKVAPVAGNKKSIK